MLPQVCNFDPGFAEPRTQHADVASRVNTVRRSFSSKPATAYFKANMHIYQIFHEVQQRAKIL